MASKLPALLGRCPSLLRQTFTGVHTNGDAFRFASNDQSIVDKFSPNIRSPFDNPNRIRQNEAVLTSKEKMSDILQSKLSESEQIERASTTTPKVEPSVSKPTIAEESVPKPEEKSITGGGGGNEIPPSNDHIDSIPRAEQVARNTRIGMWVLAAGAGITIVGFSLYYGFAKRDEKGNIIMDSYSGSKLAPFYRIRDGIREWRNYVVEPAREKLLPDPLKAPYIQPKYTLVIEMKNVLVSPEWTYKTGYRFKKRPALDYFLDVVGYPNFELVIYTSEPPMAAFGVIDNIDSKQRVMYRLFRDCTKYTNGHHVKDLNKLNRDLSKVIFIDFDPQSAKYNPENLLRLPKWDGDMDDTSLVDLAELLKTIYLSDVDDVRPVLQHYSAFDNPTAEFRRRAMDLAEKERQAKEQLQSQSSLKKYAGFFGLRRHNV